MYFGPDTIHVRPASSDHSSSQNFCVSFDGPLRVETSFKSPLQHSILGSWLAITQTEFPAARLQNRANLLRKNHVVCPGRRHSALAIAIALLGPTRKEVESEKLFEHNGHCYVLRHRLPLQPTIAITRT